MKRITKATTLLATLLSLAGWADIKETPKSFSSQESEDFSFAYSSAGATVHQGGYVSKGADFSFGKRWFFGDSGIDANLGVALRPHIRDTQFSTQASYLFKPEMLGGLYTGAGVALNIAPSDFGTPNGSDYDLRRTWAGLQLTSGLCADLPITLGYQFGESKKPGFVQVQYAPVARTASVSYGFGF